MYVFAEDLIVRLVELDETLREGTYRASGSWVGNRRALLIEREELTAGFEVGIRELSSRVNPNGETPFLANGESIRFGVWFDGKRYVIDEVVHVEQEELALHLAQKFEQDAYWSWKRSECVSF